MKNSKVTTEKGKKILPIAEMPRKAKHVKIT